MVAGAYDLMLGRKPVGNFARPIGAAVVDQDHFKVVADFGHKG